MEELLREYMSIPAKIWYNAPNLPAWAMSIQHVHQRIAESQLEVIKKMQMLGGASEKPSGQGEAPMQVQG